MSDKPVLGSSSETESQGFDLARVARDLGQEVNGDRKLPPIHLWHPDLCEGVDMRIGRDGTWYYMGSPIGRKPMVRLFSTIMRREDDDHYYVVTPVEKVRVVVEDAPFVAVYVEIEGEGAEQRLTFRTNVDDHVVAGPAHPIRVEIDGETGEPSPYVHVRDRLDALIGRSVFYELVELSVERIVDGDAVYGVWSEGEFFPVGAYDAGEGDIDDDT
jgi:uncharacterized protein